MNYKQYRANPDRIQYPAREEGKEGYRVPGEGIELKFHFIKLTMLTMK
jgi:hypothetical protein